MIKRFKLFWSQLLCKHEFESDDSDVCMKCKKLCEPYTFGPYGGY